MIRGIRGATTVTKNEKETILEETNRLLQKIIEKNELQPEDVISVQFTMTDDLDAVYPAVALRHMEGWNLIPMMCLPELKIKGSLEKCIRALFYVKTEKSQQEIKHIYLNKAVQLRPDLVERNESC